MVSENLLIRDTMSDTGQIPAEGDIWESPDIIPNGTSLHPDWSQYFKNTYNQETPGDYKPMEPGHFNYIFVRVKNISAVTQTFHVRLYYSSFMSLLMMPDTWKSNEITKLVAPKSNTLTLNPGEIGVSGFKMLPPNQPNQHHGLIATANIISSDLPNKLCNIDLDSWTRNSTEIGWRNVQILEPASVTGGEVIGNVIEIMNGNDTEELYALTAELQDAPNGTIASFESCAINGTPLSDGAIPLTTQTAPFRKLVALATLSANYKGYVLVKMTFPEPANIAPDFKAIIKYYWLPSLSFKMNGALAIPIEEAFLPQEASNKAANVVLLGGTFVSLN